MRFASPYYLLLLIPVAALVWLELRKRTGAVRFPDVSFLRRRQGLSRTLKHVVLALHTLALVCFVLALARPQRGRIIEDVESRGVDIMLCMDISESMLTADLQPDRLAAAKQRAIEFVGKRSGDRIGLVVFANGSMTVCPLTLDHAVLRTIIERLEVGRIDPTRTSIGIGLASAVARLKDSAAKGKIVILLSPTVNALTTPEIGALSGTRRLETWSPPVWVREQRLHSVHTHGFIAARCCVHAPRADLGSRRS